MRSKLWQVLALVAVVAILVPPGVMAEPNHQPPPPQPEARALEAVGPGGRGAQVASLSRLDSELRTLAAEGGDEPVPVYILAEPGADLGSVAEVTETRPFPGGELVVAEVKPAMLTKLASHPGVVAVEAFHAIEAPIPLTPRGEEWERLTREQIRQMREQAAERKAAGPPREYAPMALAAPTGPASPGDWYGKDIIGAQAAWDKGFTGEGVNIAIVDSGVDFGHPDLEGKQAVYEDGPYAGWPIALDPRSMRNYYYNGLTSWDNYSDWWDYTWYAGVYDMLHCTEGLTTTFDFNGYEYSIAPDIAALSKSDAIRWSVHPDEQLADFVWDWVPFILLDTTTAGVYDTVIADLNFDLWFDEHDDVADKADPVLNQDLGAYLTEPTYVMTGTMYIEDWWGSAGLPPTWWGPPMDEWYGPMTTEPITLPVGTWVWAPNHWTPEGADTLEDSITDVSGGMVYYIADGENPIPGMDYLYPLIPPGGNAIPFNGQLVAFMVGSYWAGGGEHGTLCASAAAAGGVITDPRAATGEQVQYAEVPAPPTYPIAVGIVGSYSDDMYDEVVNDDYLMKGDYAFSDEGNNWSYNDIRDYDMLLVDECDNCLTEDEADALVEFYDAGKPIILGMEDLDEASRPVQDAINYVFGVINARDKDFYFGTITESLGIPANHPIAQGITFLDDGEIGGDQDYFEADGADWVVRGDDPVDPDKDDNFVLAYDAGPARTVIMGEHLHDWYDAGDDYDGVEKAQPLVRNAINWAAEGIEDRGTSLFFDDFASTGNWQLSSLWHLDHMSDPFDPWTPPQVYSPTVAFNHDGLGTYTGTTAVAGSLTLAAPVTLPEAETLEFLFRSYEEAEWATRLTAPITASQEITIGVVGAYSWLAGTLNGDWRLSPPYTFIDVGDDFTPTQVITYDALVVAESAAGLTVTETQALKDFYDDGKPIVMGMDDVGMLDWSEQDVINEIFGVDKARDDDFGTPGSLSDHPISQQVPDPFTGDPGGDNEYFLEDGAEWVLQDDDGLYHVLAYEGTANTVIFGDALDDWYSAGGGGDQLVTNAIIWAIEGIDDPESTDPEEYDIRYVEISDDGGSTWDELWNSTDNDPAYPEGEWHQKWFDLSGYAGKDVLVRFRFDSVDERFNDYLGWYVDNVTIRAAGIGGEDIDYLKPDDEGTVQGPAPDAKIIAIGDCYEVVNDMQGMYDAYTFLAYGVDGEPDSGDEFVDIASMSYGDGSVHNDGWDWESRLISYYNQQYLPNTTFHASSGNGGHGFGTINSPQGNTAVSVGASTQYGATDVFGGGLALSQINDGEVQPFSGRGPDALGRPDPDVLANGAWGAGDTPVNLAYGYGAYAVPYLDGGNAWYEWGGTSRSSPEAAGVTALVYDAYYDANSAFPDFETARQMLMSGADDLNHDVLMQGAGRVNADRATDVAGELDGVYVSPSLLAAGEYDGTQYESFANVLYPGDTWDQTFTVYNVGFAAAPVTVDDEVLMQMDVLTYTVVVSPELGLEDDWYPDNYYYYADYFVVADPSKAVITTTGVTTHAIHGDSLAIPVPAGADLMQVQLVIPFEIFDRGGYNDPDPWSVSYNMDQRWSLTVYDWEDRNGDDKLWEDNSGDGVVNPQDFGDDVDISHLGVVTQTEINRFAYSYNYAAEQEVTVRLGDRTDYDSVVLGIVHRYPNDSRSGWGEEEYQENPLQVKVVFYEKADWDLVTENPTSLSVPAGGSDTFNATFTIPADQPPGLYEGAITVDDGEHTTIIPTTINVAVPDDELLFTLGGTERAGTPYDNGRTTGGWTWYNVLEEGDWRFFYYDADAGFEQQYLYVRNQWGELCDNMPTAYETLVWGPNPGDQFSLAEPEKYGPYGLQYAGGTWDANGPQNGWYDPRRGSWWSNADGTYLPESRAWATLWDGLNQVQFRNILNSGKIVCGEEFEATAGVFGVDAPYSGIVVNTNAKSGSFTLDAVSPVDGLIAWASGFGQEQWFRNQDVPQGKHYEEWPEDLLDGWVYTFEATNVSAIDVQTQGPGSSDIDLYLLYDANGDGVFNPYDNREALDYSYNWGSNENIWYDGNFSSGYWVQDGTYAVVMYGYDVYPGDQFDLRLMLYGGDNLNIEEADPEDNYVLDVTPGDPETLTVNWEVPGPGVWYGYLVFAMPWEEEDTYWYMGPYFYVPVIINKEGLDVSVEKEVDKEMVEWGDILTYDITVSNEGSEPVWMDVTDVLPEGLELINEWDVWGYDCITSTLAVEAPEYFKSNCGMWYDGGMRTVHYSCQLPVEYEGELYTEDTITFRARVEAQPGTILLNKADLKWYGSYHSDFLWDTAYSYVPVKVYLPVILR